MSDADFANWFVDFMFKLSPKDRQGMIELINRLSPDEENDSESEA